MNADSLQPGATFLHYRLVEKIGEGGMGVVWKAVDTALDREVAIKMLPPGLTADEQRRARFLREAKLLAALSHPHIAGIHQVEQVDDLQMIVMEMVEGETLAERLSRGRLSTDEALRIALQMTLALEEAHERGIVHRDLKPANVKITPKDEVKVLDFGLAKALEDEPGGPGAQPSLSHSPTLTAQMTSAGALLGTAAYMSPEQARGEAADRRADIWAFGIVLMEMLTGKTVYAGKTAADTLAGVLAREPAWDDLPDRTPPSIRRLLDRCLQKEVRDRLQAIGDARLVIQGYLDDPEADVPPETAKQPAWRSALPWALAAALALVAALGWFGREGGGASTGGAKPVTRSALVLPEGQKLHRGYGASAQLSPDGRRVVYVIDAGDRRELYVRALDQWEGTLLHAGSFDDRPYQPFFSPDGEWVGFTTLKALKKIPVTGGTAATLTEVSYNRGSSWGEDGTIVLSLKSNTGLHRVSAAGGEAEPLTELDEEKKETSHRWPQILPGGRAVLFNSGVEHDQGTDWNVELLDLADGERTLLQPGGLYPRYVSSGHVTYVADGTLYALPFDLDELRVTGAAVPVASGVAYSEAQASAQYSVSDLGHLAYVTGAVEADRRRIVWADRDGNVSSLWDQWQEYQNPAISPDGRRLAVTVMKEQSDIWVYDIERQVPTRLTSNEANETTPVWTPDGRFIVFASDREGNFDIYRRRSDGTGGAELLVKGEYSQYPCDISSDGKTLTYSQWSQGSGWDGFVTPLDGPGDSVTIGTLPFSEAFPVFSPNDRWIAYFGNESGEWEVYVRDLSGSARWQISSGGGAWPQWSPDGKELFYWWYGTVYEVEVDTGGNEFRAGRSRVLFEGGGLADLGSALPWDIAPDGRRFVAFQRQQMGSTEHGHVHLVLSWFDELERTFAGAGR